MCFESTKLLDIKEWQSIRSETWTFLKQTFEVFIKTFCRKWKVELFAKWLFVYKQLKKCQSEYYTDNLHWVKFCRHTSLHVPHFTP